MHYWEHECLRVSSDPFSHLGFWELLVPGALGCFNSTQAQKKNHLKQFQSFCECYNWAIQYFNRIACSQKHMEILSSFENLRVADLPPKKDFKKLHKKRKNADDNRWRIVGNLPNICILYEKLHWKLIISMWFQWAIFNFFFFFTLL